MLEAELRKEQFADQNSLLTRTNIEKNRKERWEPLKTTPVFCFLILRLKVLYPCILLIA